MNDVTCLFDNTDGTCLLCSSGRWYNVTDLHERASVKLAKVNPGRLLTADDAAYLLGVTPETLHIWTTLVRQIEDLPEATMPDQPA